MCILPCLSGDCACLPECIHVCECVCLYGGCVAFVCASGHVCIVIVCACVGVFMFVPVCACMVIVLCLYVCFATLIY